MPGCVFSCLRECDRELAGMTWHHQSDELKWDKEVQVQISIFVSVCTRASVKICTNVRENSHKPGF